jgi:uncharacterized membrane protein (UPF0127 family)
MSKFLIIVLVLASASVFFFLGKARPSKQQPYLTIGAKSLKIEIAKTPEQRQKGLSDRQALCPDCGLLFIFDQPGVYPFWMRRMHFDIDMIWINGEEIIDITHSAKKPVPEEFDSPKQIYQSRAPVDKVLEVNAGWCERNGIEIGDRVEGI